MIDICPSALLREQGSEATASAASVITMLVEANPFSIGLSQHSQKRDHREAIVYRLIDFLRDEVLPGRCVFVFRRKGF